MFNFFSFLLLFSIYFLVVDSLQWKDAYDLTVEGLAFEKSSLESDYDRLPYVAKVLVPEDVWNQSIRSAGVYIEFITDSSSIYVNYSLNSTYIDFWSMPASSVSGIDILGFDETSNMYRWMGNWENPNFENFGLVLDGLTVKRQYRIYLPPYNRVAFFHVGVDDDATIFEESQIIEPKYKFVWYGSSILQGKATANPSSIVTTQVALQMYPSVDFFNFGFSGSCHMDISVVDIFHSIEGISGYIIDCLPNMNSSSVAEKTIPLVQNIRAAKGELFPIFLVENAIYGTEWWDASFAKSQQTKRNNLRAAYDTLIEDGDVALYYVEGNMLLAPNTGTQCTAVDGVHPTDLGFSRMTDYWVQYLTGFLSVNYKNQK